MIYHGECGTGLVLYDEMQWNSQKKKVCRRFSRFKILFVGFFDVTNLTMTTLQKSNLLGELWFGAPAQLTVELRLQEAPSLWSGSKLQYDAVHVVEEWSVTLGVFVAPGCLSSGCKNSNSHMVFQWIAQRILQQFFEEIIHIQGGIKELNTKMLLLILSELLTVRREFSACLVFRAWWGSFLTVLVGVFKARSPTMLSFPALHILKYAVCSLRKKSRLTL